MRAAVRRLTAEEHVRLAEAIRAAEARTAGEIYVVVAERSDEYNMLPRLWAALITLIGGFVSALIFPRIAAGSLALGQALVFVVLLALTFVPRLRILFVPRTARTACARAHAREQFLAHNLHATQSRTGVLVFVSLAERHAEILADVAIDTAVPDDFWQRIVDGLTAEIREGRLAEGLVQAVQACGEALAAHFPRRPDDRNELPDKVVEI